MSRATQNCLPFVSLLRLWFKMNVCYCSLPLLAFHDIRISHTQPLAKFFFLSYIALNSHGQTKEYNVYFLAKTRLHNPYLNYLDRFFSVGYCNCNCNYTNVQFSEIIRIAGKKCKGGYTVAITLYNDETDEGR